ncbi:MAG: dihydrolipoamide acetyltransferase family protein [Ornithinimicrobium sp.]|uniref:dihydrolipoamide acetyltransferase family protein n=1 Tax=Ornithinimicrobium sp. TaxID=1977084 RepID=UPI0026DEF229|nr:dihydrolipoamide acetyltransferase family protein [Ornithinimicrobium sp.]MDO5741023.1 dihydrolipoamide acetyltransferase family protein [Ornithinimicrobium sp.]
MSAPAHVFMLPDLGEGLTEAEVTQWLVAVGDEVAIDQDVVTVETAKAAVDVPCPAAGVVTKLHAEPGTMLAVGAPLITIGGEPDDAGGADGARDADRVRDANDPSQAAGAGGDQYRTEERAGTTAPPHEATTSPDQPERPLIGYGASDGPVRRTRRGRRQPSDAPAEAATEAATSPSLAPDADPNAPTGTAVEEQRAVRVISPLVRKLAQEWDLDLSQVAPGPTGVIRRADLEAARAGQTPEAAAAPLDRGRPAGAREDVHVPIQGVHKLMVERLTTSRREIPDATTWVDVDATAMMKLKDRLKTTRPEAAIGVLPLLARIVVAGLTTYPALNSSVDLQAGQIVHHGAINLGFAAQSPRGLVVPVVQDAGSMTTTELAAALRELTIRAREGVLTPAELIGGTFTLNNYGVFGVDGSTPIINYPEAAMLGVGRIIDKPWVHKGKLKIRKITQLGFTFDHRVCDGGTAGGFLRFVADCIEEPAGMLADL